MKHLKTFESFTDSENTNEWLGQKFITGHADATEKNAAKQKIEQDIENGISAIMANPNNKLGDPEKIKQFLLNSAKENNWKGSIKTRRSRKDGRLFLVYEPGKSSLQHAISPITPDSKFGGY